MKTEAKPKEGVAAAAETHRLIPRMDKPLQISRHSRYRLVHALLYAPLHRRRGRQHTLRV